MPGQIAHMMVVDQFNGSKLDTIPGFPPQATWALLDTNPYTELGSFSPDLAFYYPPQSGWADRMHRQATGQMIQAGVAPVAAMTDSARKEKCFAWLCGYASHVVADVTIHPVVRLMCKGDSNLHRKIETHQDSYIADLLNVGPLEDTDLFVGVESCFPEPHFDPDIASLWNEMLMQTYPDECAHDPPKLDRWHDGFKILLEKIAVHGGAIPFGRHLGNDLGALYPSHHEIDLSFINNVPVPGGGTENYPEIFQRAVRATQMVWLAIARGVYAADPSYRTVIRDWNLDDGTGPDGKLAFWS